MALVQLSVVEQRLDAVRAVLAGAQVGEVAASLGLSRQSVCAWMVRYLAGGVAGLVDRSHRPRSSPAQVAGVVEVAVVEMRRQHPRWGAKRIRMELLRRPPTEWAVPSVRTINRVLVSFLGPVSSISWHTTVKDQLSLGKRQGVFVL
jgi:transposase